jgi:hypothetical protein
VCANKSITYVPDLFFLYCRCADRRVNMLRLRVYVALLKLLYRPAHSDPPLRLFANVMCVMKWSARSGKARSCGRAGKLHAACCMEKGGQGMIRWSCFFLLAACTCPSFPFSMSVLLFPNTKSRCEPRLDESLLSIVWVWGDVVGYVGGSGMRHVSWFWIVCRVVGMYVGCMLWRCEGSVCF